MIKQRIYPLAMALASLPLLLTQQVAAATSYEMQRECKDRAVARYHIERESIHTAVPRFLYGKYSVYAKSPKEGENALFFVCDFNRNKRFIGMKIETDKRIKDTKPTQAAKRSCRGEASSVWRVPQRNVRITNTTQTNAGRYKMQVRSGKRTAVCDVNTQGHIYSFKSERRQTAGKVASRACKQLASRFWKVPVSRISIDKVDAIHKEHTILHLRFSGVVEGRCDVNPKSGYVYHFKTHKK